MSVNAEGSTVLTKDLIQCRLKGDKLQPILLDTANPELLAHADQLLTAFRQCIGSRKEELATMLEPILSDIRPLALGKGLRKLLEDRSEFSNPDPLDYPAERQKLLTLSANLLNQQPWPSYEAFRQALMQAAGDNNPLLRQGGLYADLPENDSLVSFKDLNPRQLLERYNLGQVQALLLSAEYLELSVDSAEPAKLRRLCKYLRFFRLLCQIKAGSGGNALKLRIDGPASLFENSRKYGLQLAIFFPAVCTLETWRMKAEVQWKEKKRILQLDQSSGLVCPYHIFSACVPEEIKLFHRHFKETVPDWKIVGETPFLRGENNEIIFPDLSFASESGEIRHLELFHRYHASRLPARLEWLEKHPEIPLILGVDKTLLRNPALEEQLENSTWFQQNGFLFRDYPSCEKTRQCLKRVQGAGGRGQG
jgi:predicted nuclease of restriction endonuclease-like RecB superfamily